VFWICIEEYTLSVLWKYDYDIDMFLQFTLRVGTVGNCLDTGFVFAMILVIKAECSNVY